MLRKMKEPLLSEEKSQSDRKKWRSYESLGRLSSVLPTTPLLGIEVSIDEIWSATGIYPPISSLEPSYLPPKEQAVGYQGGYRGAYVGYGNDVQRQMFDEVEIHSVKGCNVYVETLETFLEERKVQKEMIPYVGDSVHTKDKGPQIGIWELDLRSEFPALFVPYKEIRLLIPHSKIVEKFLGCEDAGMLFIPLAIQVNNLGTTMRIKGFNADLVMDKV